MIVRVMIDYGGGVHFHRAGYRPPLALPGVMMPILISVDPLRRAARASHLSGVASGEIPNTRFSLKNGAGEISELFTSALPLRRRVWMFDDRGTVRFSGLVMQISLAATTVITVEG